jgi:DNA invertase Pin-like site-specific DNA recombinase
MEKRSAFGYCRVSGDSQAEGDGFSRQREAIEKYCRKGPYKIKQFFEDVHTGSVDAVDRPAFADMVQATDGTRTVIIERLDRLARSVVAQEHTVLWMAAHEIELVVADTGENVTESYAQDPMKKALIQMQGVFAELEKSMIVKKLRVARERIRKDRGKCEGRKRYGEQDPGEKATVKRIKELRRKRGKNKLSLRKIAAALDAEGRPPRSGGTWSAQAVKNIVDRKRC